MQYGVNAESAGRPMHRAGPEEVSRTHPVRQRSMAVSGFAKAAT